MKGNLFSKVAVVTHVSLKICFLIDKFILCVELTWSFSYVSWHSSSATEELLW